jgi:hypothetical protein
MGGPSWQWHAVQALGRFPGVEALSRQFATSECFMLAKAEILMHSFDQN